MNAARRALSRRSLPIALALALATAASAEAGGSLGIPTTIDGYPANVGLLILGHSTSQTGDYPGKLARALNDPGNSADGRHYFVISAAHGGDGGFLWSRVSFAPTDIQYDRVRASRGASGDQVNQWCEDDAGTRWSCRRAKVDSILTGSTIVPTTGTCAARQASTSCAQPLVTCTWYDRGRPLSQNPVTQGMSANECWLKMDTHLVLIQDTTNRSWEVDDFTGDGSVNASDFWPSSRIPAEAWPCRGTSGVVNGSIDWNCDGALTGADAALTNYSSWLLKLSRELLDPTRYGTAAAEHVFLTQKPLEMTKGVDCTLFPTSEQTACRGAHSVRTASQISATPGRPFDHYYLPTVYWEYRAIDQIFNNPTLDSRIRRATPAARDMWNRSVKGYDIGLDSADWTIPSTVSGRPTTVAADDTEMDAGQTPNAATVGTLLGDHVHHTEAGGWMMADVWYAGLRPYLQ
jgi:hypothetical protein